MKRNYTVIEVLNLESASLWCTKAFAERADAESYISKFNQFADETLNVYFLVDIQAEPELMAQLSPAGLQNLVKSLDKVPTWVLDFQHGLALAQAEK